ncbi:hypothetical protein L2E82_50534 [Cichorium intybus]|nr:hypothetical protein L2E82_50534 [Cichorium intybus]
MAAVADFTTTGKLIVCCLLNPLLYIDKWIWRDRGIGISNLRESSQQTVAYLKTVKVVIRCWCCGGVAYDGGIETDDGELRIGGQRVMRGREEAVNVSWW